MENKEHKSKTFETIIAVGTFLFIIFVLVGNFIYGTNTARIWVSIVFLIIAWIILGCAVLAGIDNNNELYEWVWDKAPNGCFSVIAILLFPIVAFVYLRNRRKIK